MDDKPYGLAHCKLIMESCFDGNKVSKLAILRAIRDAYCEGVIDTKIAWFDAQVKATIAKGE